MESELLFEGGVSRFPTLTAEVACCGGLEAGYEEYFEALFVVNCDKGGGGSSKAGRFEAACRRAVKL